MSMVRYRKAMIIVWISYFCCSSACTFTVTNNCPYTIWPATLSGSGTPQLPLTGFQLSPGQTIGIPSVKGWSGRIWGRTGCNFDASGFGTCQTGDCGARLECNGIGAAPPTSLFEITLGKTDADNDFYDVSFVDGYNLPIFAQPRGGHGNCNATGCASDINMGCPKELQVLGGVEQVEREGAANVIVGCKSACSAFGLDEYCCSGVFANPTTCRPSFYSTIFKRACPSAYSYAFDDGTSTFTCKSHQYSITFCPNINRIYEPNHDYAITDPLLEQEKHKRAIVGAVSSSSNIQKPLITIILACYTLASFTFT